MKTNCFSRFFLRFRYPFALPEDIALDLGIDISSFVTFDEFIKELINPKCCPKTLTKLMPRSKAENTFQGAQKKEVFMRSSLFSYYFNEGWLEFKLEFDSNSLLRRVYIQHKDIQEDQGIELHLAS